MKIALCISGQPRTWKKAYANWLEKLLPNFEKDIFFHLWNYNTLPTIVETQNGITSNPDIAISTEEQQEIIDTLKPKKFKFDNRNVNPKGHSDPKLFTEYVSKPLGWWCRSQFYSLYYAAQLKREFEIENNFEYDLVLRMRTDLYFLDDLIIPDKILPNSLYSVSNGWMDNTESFMIGDTFYLADSFTYDQVSELIHAFNFIDTHHVVPRSIECPPPEVAFYNFLCLSGIKNISCRQNFKILRTKDYHDIRGELALYETI